LRQRKVEGRPMFTHQDIAGMIGCSTSYVKKVLAKSRKDHGGTASSQSPRPSFEKSTDEGKTKDKDS